MLQEMGFAPNIYVYYHLVHKAHWDFGYLHGVLEHMTQTGVKPQVKLILTIERALVSGKKALVQAVRTSSHEYVLSVLSHGWCVLVLCMSTS